MGRDKIQGLVMPVVVYSLGVIICLGFVCLCVYDCFGDAINHNKECIYTEEDMRKAVREAKEFVLDSLSGVQDEDDFEEAEITYIIDTEGCVHSGDCSYKHRSCPFVFDKCVLQKDFVGADRYCSLCFSANECIKIKNIAERNIKNKEDE